MEEQLFEQMANDGVIAITSTIDSESTNKIIMSLLSYGLNPEKEIQLFISSTSLDYTNILAIYDVMKSLPNPISTFAVGLVSGCAVLLLVSGDKDKRYILKNSQVCLNELYDAIGSGSNQQTEMELLSKDILEKERIFESILKRHTTLNEEKIHEFCKQSTTFNANQAVGCGFVDVILE